MGIKIIEDLKALRSNSYEHGIDLRKHIASRAIKALEDAYREIDKLESEDLSLRTQLTEARDEIERLRGLVRSSFREGYFHNDAGWAKGWEQSCARNALKGGGK